MFSIEIMSTFKAIKPHLKRRLVSLISYEMTTRVISSIYYIVTFIVFIAYCSKNVNIITRLKQKGMCIYIMPLNDITKHTNEESN